MCYNQTKFVKNELYMERFHGNRLKKPRNQFFTKFGKKISECTVLLLQLLQTPASRNHAAERTQMKIAVVTYRWKCLSVSLLVVKRTYEQCDKVLQKKK